MGTTGSTHQHRYRANKHQRCRNERPIIQHCRHKDKEIPIGSISNPALSKGHHETIVPLIRSLPLNPSLHGSILNSSFPMQRSYSEVQIHSFDDEQERVQQYHNDSYDDAKGVYDYQKHMQRVDEENRPVLEGLCPDKMYVSTNDLRICDTQRLPPPLRCKVAQGFFRPIPPPSSSSKSHGKKPSINASFL